MPIRDEIEAKAAARAINETLKMIDDAFQIRAGRGDPTARRKTVIKKLKRRFAKLQQQAVRPPPRGPVVSDLVSRIERAAELNQGLCLDSMVVQRLAKVIPHGALGHSP